MTTLLKLGFSGYDVKPRFCAFQCEYLLQNPLSPWGKILVTLDTYAKKIDPPSIVLGGGVHGRVCWLIAYNTCHAKISMTQDMLNVSKTYNNIKIVCRDITLIAYYLYVNISESDVCISFYSSSNHLDIMIFR